LPGICKGLESAARISFLSSLSPAGGDVPTEPLYCSKMLLQILHRSGKASE
jgi:hypothetical protein